jgi:hypothetical protein
VIGSWSVICDRILIRNLWSDPRAKIPRIRNTEIEPIGKIHSHTVLLSYTQTPKGILCYTTVCRYLIKNWVQKYSPPSSPSRSYNLETVPILYSIRASLIIRGFSVILQYTSIWLRIGSRNIPPPSPSRSHNLETVLYTVYQQRPDHKASSQRVPPQTSYPVLCGVLYRYWLIRVKFRYI